MKLVNTLVLLLLGWLPCTAFAEELPDAVREDVALIFKVGNELDLLYTAADGDCARLGADLNAWIEGNGEVLGRFHEALSRMASLPDDKHTLIESTYKAEIKRFEDQMVKLVSCGSDPIVEAAIKRLYSSDNPKEDPATEVGAAAATEWGPNCRLYLDRLTEVCLKPTSDKLKQMCEPAQQAMEALAGPSPDSDTANALEPACEAALVALEQVVTGN